MPCFSDHLSQAEVRQDCRAPQASAKLSQRQGLRLSALFFVWGHSSLPDILAIPTPQDFLKDRPWFLLIAINLICMWFFH